EDVPAIWEKLEGVGLSTTEAWGGGRGPRHRGPRPGRAHVGRRVPRAAPAPGSPDDRPDHPDLPEHP
ncbi:hypothetical protein ACFV6E_42375, partial [Streptomyces sp. NPDC059785]|uniref:hypothetical protein n=1 Tax=Streptomyces sp. NPDC059785 TaxID=3346945 RepID=UPI0036690A89